MCISSTKKQLADMSSWRKVYDAVKSMVDGTLNDSSDELRKLRKNKTDEINAYLEGVSSALGNHAVYVQTRIGFDRKIIMFNAAYHGAAYPWVILPGSANLVETDELSWSMPKGSSLNEVVFPGDALPDALLDGWDKIQNSIYMGVRKRFKDDTDRMINALGERFSEIEVLKGEAKR